MSDSRGENAPLAPVRAARPWFTLPRAIIYNNNILMLYLAYSKTKFNSYIRLLGTTHFRYNIYKGV